MIASAQTLSMPTYLIRVAIGSARRGDYTRDDTRKSSALFFHNRNLLREKYPSPIDSILVFEYYEHENKVPPTDKGKRVERRGRKAKGLKRENAKTAKLPKWNSKQPRICLFHTIMESDGFLFSAKHPNKNHL
ncbi:hypothetical protein ANRL2_01700 [Anaerolineae bacterium]|nr:hypothetical protein ANRL2_01700 [Anaerolineae bacterium]